METQDSINARALHVQQALQAAFGVRGKTLASALHRTGRRMPRRLHAEAAKIVDAQRLGGHPKLLRRVDKAALAAAEDRIVSYLRDIDRADRRKGFWLGIGGAIAFNLLIIIAGFIVWMVWTGLL